MVSSQKNINEMEQPVSPIHMHLVHKAADTQVASVGQGGTGGPLLHMHLPRS